MDSEFLRKNDIIILMEYFIFLLGITVISFSVGIVYIVSMGSLVKRINQQSPVADIAKRWKTVSTLVMTFAILYFLLRLFQYNISLHDTVHVVFDIFIFLLLLSSAIISRKNVSLIKYWGLK